MSEKIKIANLALLLAALSGALFFFFPVSERNGAWAHCVLNNWEQYGFFTLQGQLVTNPGGHGALDEPQIYGGHKPHVARAAYFIGSLTGKPGEDGWLFHVILSVIVGISIWLGFGKTNWATLLAICTIISPGFIRCPLQLDTLAIPVLLGIPILFLASNVFSTSAENRGKTILFFFLLVFYTQINWTTALSVFVIFTYLIVSHKLSIRSLIVFLAISGAAIGFVLITSLLHKKSGSNSLAESAILFFNSYLFGAGGYGGIPMDWTIALRRIAVANLIGLMPFLIGILFIAWKSGIAKTFRIFHFLPLAASGLCICVLRNYFAAHPWMAAPVLLIGLIATLKVQLDYQTQEIPSKKTGIPNMYWAMIAIASLIYSLMIIEVFRLNSSASDSIAKMVKTHTQRGDLLAIDPTSFGDRPVEKWLGHLCDRMVIQIFPLKTIQKNWDVNYFILSTQSSKEGFIEVAKTSDFNTESSQALSKLLQFYRNKISRRAVSDSPLPAKIYYLHSPANP